VRARARVLSGGLLARGKNAREKKREREREEAKERRERETENERASERERAREKSATERATERARATERERDETERGLAGGDRGHAEDSRLAVERVRLQARDLAVGRCYGLVQYLCVF